MIQGSQLPPEARMNQILERFDMGAEYAETLPSTSPNTASPDFRDMALMMQYKMMSESMLSSDDDDDGGIFGSANSMMMDPTNMMMGANPQMMSPQMMMGAMPQMMMGAGMMGSNMMGMTDPMMLQGYMQTLNGSASDTAQIPVQGRISSNFGPRSHPVHGGQSFHEGVDIAAPLGSPIQAPWSGQVVFVGHADGFGAKTVVIAHPDTERADGKIVYSVFGHNKDVFVRVGDEVKQGQAFATVGNDGDSTGPHVHWETRIAEPGLYGKQIFHKQLSYATNPMKFV